MEEAVKTRAVEGFKGAKYLELVETIGTYLNGNSRKGFTLDYQEFAVSDNIRLFFPLSFREGEICMCLSPLRDR